MGTFYAPPRDDADVDNPQLDVGRLINDLFVQNNAAQGAKWIFAGDANEVPGQSIIEELLCALWLSAGQRYVEKQHPTHRGTTSIYMDDRSFTAKTASELMSCLNSWGTWSDSVGLLEPRSKAQVIARGKHNQEALRAVCPDNTFTSDFGRLFLRRG